MLFFRRAKHFSKINNPGGTWPTIAPPSIEWIEWREYFERHVGQVPLVMRKMLDRSADAPAIMTVPTQFPVQFDHTFRPIPGWKSEPARQVCAKELRESLDELERRYGPAWGFKTLSQAIAKHAAPYRPLTDDELRALYPRKPKDKPEEAE